MDGLVELANLRRSLEEAREKVRSFIAQPNQPILKEFGEQSFYGLTKLLRITMLAENELQESRKLMQKSVLVSA